MVHKTIEKLDINKIVNKLNVLLKSNRQEYININNVNVQGKTGAKFLVTANRTREIISQMLDSMNLVGRTLNEFEEKKKLSMSSELTQTLKTVADQSAKLTARDEQISDVFTSLFSGMFSVIAAAAGCLILIIIVILLAKFTAASKIASVALRKPGTATKEEQRTTNH